MKLDPRLSDVVTRQPYPLLFVTVSGAHLYGFPSPDSDHDLRGVHVLPVGEVAGLDCGAETVEDLGVRDGLDLDLVTHDARKFFRLMLQRNGYVLEQLYSPLVLHTTPEHVELKAIGHACITKRHAYHYLGFANSQWKLWGKEEPRRVKPLLYVYRVLLTGLHLMHTGKVEANLLVLNETERLPYVDELVARKLAGPERATLDGADLAFHAAEYERLCAALKQASDTSHLPDEPSARPALHDLLLRLRVQGIGADS